eukprot:gene24590-biopygen13461
MPAPRPRHSRPIVAYSPRHARAMPAPPSCPPTEGKTKAGADRTRAGPQDSIQTKRTRAGSGQCRFSRRSCPTKAGSPTTGGHARCKCNRKLAVHMRTEKRQRARPGRVPHDRIRSASRTRPQSFLPESRKAVATGGSESALMCSARPATPVIRSCAVSCAPHFNEVTGEGFWDTPPESPFRRREGGPEESPHREKRQRTRAGCAPHDRN